MKAPSGRRKAVSGSMRPPCWLPRQKAGRQPAGQSPVPAPPQVANDGMAAGSAYSIRNSTPQRSDHAQRLPLVAVGARIAADLGASFRCPGNAFAPRRADGSVPQCCGRRVSRIRHLRENLHRAGFAGQPWADTACHQHRLGKGFGLRNSGGGWAVETLCVWMWIPSRAVGIVQSRSDRFGSGLVRMAACDRLLHRHAFVRDRP